MNPVQLRKAELPISVTELGMTRIPERLVHLSKAFDGITLRASDNLRLVNPEHLSKADAPIVVTELGNVKDSVNPEHS